MAIDISINSITCKGDGTVQSFSLPFPVFEKEHIGIEGRSATGDATAYVNGVDYTVSIITGANDAFIAASVTLTRPLARGSEITIRRVVPIVQTTVLANQGPLSPRSIEKQFDYRTMVDQQLQGGIDAVGSAVLGFQEDVDRLDAQTADLADAIAAETESRVAADIALDRRIDNEKASLLQRIDENKANLARLDDDKMPKAPDNGAIYVGSGGTWLPLVFDIGDPFVYDADGDVVIVERPAYLTNSIWVIHPNELIVSEACQPGNRDSIFIVDADGDIVIQ